MHDNGFYASAVNRAYYAVFYAANALLATKKLARSKHSGVISAFREYFIKTGIIENDHSRTFGQLFDDRHISDYDINISVDVDQVVADVSGAIRFVDRMDEFLKEGGWI